MEMTIDEAAYIIEHHKVNDISNAYDIGQAFIVAIKTMHKYQKIKELMDKEVPECIHPLDRDKYKLGTIRKVLEDGNDD